MANIRDITSTEKLLNVIRSRKEGPASPPGPNEPKVPRKGIFKLPLPSLPSIVSNQKTDTVGIDIGHDYLRMVRASGASDGNWELLDRRRLPLPPKTPRTSPEFSAFLKASLASFCGSSKQTDLWLIMSAARVDVRHIRIPKVSRKQIDNVVYWTAKKETPFDERELVFDFESQGEVIEQGIPKLAAMVYTAPRQEIEDLKSQFARIGWPLTGISVVPFAVQNLFRTGWIPTLEGTIASLFIGNDFSRIDIYAEGNLVMTRGIKAGLSSMVEAFCDRFNELKTNPDEPLLTPEQSRKIVRSLSPDTPPLEKTDAGYDLAKETIFEMIEPAMERLVRQVERTFEHYAMTMPGERIARVFVSGAMNIYQPIVDYVGSQLGIASAVLDPLEGHVTDVCVDVDDKNCVSERIAFGPALGLALSANDHTPNLMFTYKAKEREASVVRINRMIFAGFMVSVLLCAAAFIFQNIAIAGKKNTIAGIEAQISRLGPSVDRNQLMRLAAKVTQRRQLSKGYADRYLGMVLISELASLTPANVRFLDLKINLGTPVTQVTPLTPADAAKPAKPRVEEVTVEGLILGERQLFETSLAAYTMALEASPLFRQVSIQKNDIVPYIKAETLHFILNLKVEEHVHG